ncbi:hypothetical protein F5Y15DRAFT_423514 [Xylariaceae sp. FL0016]|nr:hypothetical protein F5Y15DRAFT_423514 [Xylariaceae sp. FL0016]
MPKIGVKRTAEADLGSDRSDGLFVKEDSHNKRSKTSKAQHARLSRLAEYDEDEGRTASRNFQKWAQIYENSTKGEVKRSETFMRNFKPKINRQADGLRTILRKEEEKLSQDRGISTRILDTMHLAEPLSPRPGSNSDREQTVVNKERRSLEAEAKSYIVDSWDLVKQFKDVNGILRQNERERPDVHWNQDKKEMKGLLFCGHEHGVQMLENMLAAASHRLHQLDRPDMSEKQVMASSMFKRSREAFDGDTWGDVKERHVRQFSVIAKVLPLSEDDNDHLGA